MINFSKYNTIFWDFDGVLMDSMPLRDKGFEVVLSSYPRTQVEALLSYHRRNGGLSRYVKFRYFFESIRNETITEHQVNELARSFSDIMRRELCNPEMLIGDAIDFVKQNHRRFSMHIISGSDQDELRFVCQRLEIAPYFKTIHGSPTAKKQWVKELLQSYHYAQQATVLIGDSVNDLEAALENGIDFIGYNNALLKENGKKYIHSFADYAE